MNEADRYSLEALRSIHQMMDDDKDGGIEVEESVEVQHPVFLKPLQYVPLSFKCAQIFIQARESGKSYTPGAMASFRVECYFRDNNSINAPLAH